MKRFIISLGLLMLVPAAMRAQEADTASVVEQRFILPVNLSGIQQMSQDEAAYNELVSKFEQGSDDLGLFDISVIYYGWIFKPGYKGNRDVEQSPAEKLMSEGRFLEAWDEGVEYLKENPVSLLTLQHVLNAGNAIGKSEAEMAPYMKRFNQILQLIYYSGDGLSEDTAFKVISISDEHVFMQRVLGVGKYAARNITRAGVDRFDVVNARNFDQRFLFIDATMAQHFGPAWIPEEVDEPDAGAAEQTGAEQTGTEQGTK